MALTANTVELNLVQIIKKRASVEGVVVVQCTAVCQTETILYSRIDVGSHKCGTEIKPSRVAWACLLFCKEERAC